MEQKKDCSLLRPFDLEAAKRGEKILWIDNPARWLALSDQAGYARNIVEHDQGLSYVRDVELRMAPLCWVEGRPVYPGDTLYQAPGGGEVLKRTALGLSDCGRYLNFEERGSWAIDGHASKLTWEEPNPVLCEVEGRPVRKGDRLWSNYFKEWFTVSGKRVVIEEVSLINERGGDTLATSCSWKRKVKKQGFINIYPLSWMDGRAGNIFPTKDEADSSSRSGRIACAQVDWEEEASE